jgi:amidase
LVKQYFFDHADEEMQRHTEIVVEQLRQDGADIKEISLASFEAISDAGEIIVSVEASTYHQAMFAENNEQYEPRIRELIEKGLSIPAIQYARALEVRLEQCAEIEALLENVNALITPGATGAAPRSLYTTGSSVMQRPLSVVGLPTISLPTGLNKDGLPLAIQLIGPPRGEDKLLAVALWCEQALDVRLKPLLD